MSNIKKHQNGITHALLMAFSVMMLFPFLAIVLTSFKTREGVLTSPPTLFPATWSFDGYSQLFHSNMVISYLPNTIINAVVASLIVIPIASMAGYLFARYRFRGNRLLQIAILSLIMVPSLTHLIPFYRLASRFDLLNTNTIMIAYHVGGGLPFSIWIAKSFFVHIPREVEESALIDGASIGEIIWYVFGPMALPGLFAMFLIQLVESWNELLAAVVLLSQPAAKTASVGLLDFQSQFEVAYHVQAAGCVLIALPVVIVFLFTHKFFFRAMMDGASIQ